MILKNKKNKKMFADLVSLKHSAFLWKIGKINVETQVRRHRIWHLIRISTIFLTEHTV